MDIITIIQSLQSLWIIFIMIMLIFRFHIGVAAYLAYFFLVPYMRIELGGVVLQWNFINILVLLTFFIHQHNTKNKRIKYDWRPLLPFVLYFGVSLLLMPFQDGLTFSESINSWRLQAMKYLILPFVIWNDIKANKASLKLYRNVTIGCIIIAVLYGLFLTTMPGLNPYMTAISAANGGEFNMAYAAGNSGTGDNLTLNEDRMFGRISSVFSHPMTFGLFLGFALFYLYRNKIHTDKWLLYGLTILIIVDIIVCGVRSVIGATIIAVFFLLTKTRNIKLYITIAISICVIMIIVSFIPTLYNYIGSIFDKASSNTSGSSIEMRLLQLEGCFNEIDNDIISGKGYSWTSHYNSLFGGHPTMLYFESLVYVVLCNSGLIGVVLWLVMGICIVKYNNRRKQPIAALLNSLFVFYISYACITGEYGYMQYFIIFYILMLGEDMNLEKRRIPKMTKTNT